MKPTPPKSRSKSRLWGGTAWITLAEALILPTGFITLTFLTRQLGTTGYGLFALSATLVTWIEWGLNSVFARTTIKFVSEAEETDAIATAVLRAQLSCGLLAALIVIVCAPTVADLLHEPALTPLLRLFALEIPLVNLAQAHQNILAGLGKFGARAVATAVRWMARLLFIFAFVSLGFSLSGAILGSLAAMMADVIICRLYIQPSLWAASTFPLQALAGYAVPLFLAALSTRLFAKIDLIALKVLGGTAEQAGIYAVAQSLALFGGVMSPALAPVLIATVSQLLSEEKSSQEKSQAVRSLSRSAMRVVFLHIPFAALITGSAWDIVPLLFGEAFITTATLLGPLIFATVCTVMIAVTSAILVASDRPNWTAMLTVPMPLLAIVCHGLLVPRFDTIGAAAATLIVAGTGAFAGVVAVYVRWNVLPAGMTLIRCGLTGLAVGAIANYWSTPGLWVLLKLFAGSVSIVILLWLLGEVSENDRRTIRTYLSQE
ncbi:MAG: oligosaccharide flippase family protein [Cyanobacteria bacterium J06621_11]